MAAKESPKTVAKEAEAAKEQAVEQAVEQVLPVVEQQVSNQDPRLMDGDNEDVDTSNPDPTNPKNDDYHGGPAYEPK